jgi:hypothetical protein
MKIPGGCHIRIAPAADPQSAKFRASAFALDLPMPSFCAQSRDPEFVFVVSLAMDSATQLRCAQNDG